MASKTRSFEVSLRLGGLGRHTVTLAAPDAGEAKRKATLDAVATSGGELDAWTVMSCDQIAAQVAA